MVAITSSYGFESLAHMLKHGWDLIVAKVFSLKHMFLKCSASLLRSWSIWIACSDHAMVNWYTGRAALEFADSTHIT